MSEHFTLRIRSETSERLERRSRASSTKARTLAARYIEEGLRHDDHPLIHFVDGFSGRRAAVIGTGLDVWEVVTTLRDNDGDAGETADYLGMSRAVVDAAVAYYGEFQDEIDAEVELNDYESKRAYAAWEAGRQALAT